MSANLKSLARSAGYSVSNMSLTIPFENGRRQVVRLDDSDPEVGRLWCVLLPPSKTQEFTAGDPLAYAWKRNRFSDLVGFSVDERGRFIGETWVPMHGLTARELQLHILELARVCDLHEVRLLGANSD